MGTYINKGNNAFERVRKSEYVDKSGLIAIVNETLFTEHCFSCVTRCRRFGKSMAAKMLCAYYDCSCDSRSLFADLEIAKHPSFEQHLNKYPVLYVDMTDFMAKYRDENIVKTLDAKIRADVCAAYPGLPTLDDDDLMDLLLRVVEQTKKPFVFIIDEWDVICREFKPGSKAMENYVDWLRRLFKSVQAVDAFAGVYMTGILPIKKFRVQSAMNNFREYSMVTPRAMSRYFGFTQEEVLQLAEKHNMDFSELEKWYDGYQIGDQPSMFNPNSVMESISCGYCESFWGRTGATDPIADFIKMNYEGLKDDIISMLGGAQCRVNPTGFNNDLHDVRSRDDVLTVLIHLGYLSYDRVSRRCRIPNLEVSGEMELAVRDTNWEHVTDALRQSEVLLDATLASDAETVAHMVDKAHDEHTSILSYNNENSMACVLSIAYYYAHNDYIFHRELPTGKGFADLVLIPRKNVDKPALVLELKYDHDTQTAIDQIRQKNYPAKIAEYVGDILLVGINYDREQKMHSCQIETWRKEE